MSTARALQLAHALARNFVGHGDGLVIETMSTISTWAIVIDSRDDLLTAELKAIEADEQALAARRGDFDRRLADHRRELADFASAIAGAEAQALGARFRSITREVSRNALLSK